MEPLFHYGHVPVQAYIVLSPHPENINADTDTSKVGDKRKNDEENTPKWTNAKRIRIGDGMIPEKKSNQEDNSESQEPAGPDNSTILTLPEVGRVLFGRAT